MTLHMHLKSSITREFSPTPFYSANKWFILKMCFNMNLEVPSSSKHFMTCWARVPFSVFRIMEQRNLHIWSDQITDHSLNILIVLFYVATTCVCKLGETFIAIGFHPNQFSNFNYLLIRNLRDY